MFLVCFVVVSPCSPPLRQREMRILVTRGRQHETPPLLLASSPAHLPATLSFETHAEPCFVRYVQHFVMRDSYREREREILKVCTPYYYVVVYLLISVGRPLVQSLSPLILLRCCCCCCRCAGRRWFSQGFIRKKINRGSVDHPPQRTDPPASLQK